MKNPFVISFCLICGLITFVSVQKMQESLTLIEESDEYLIAAEQVLKRSYSNILEDRLFIYEVSGKTIKGIERITELNEFQQKHEELEKNINIIIEQIMAQEDKSKNFNLLDFLTFRKSDSIRTKAKPLYIAYQNYAILLHKHAKKYDMEVSILPITEYEFIKTYFSNNTYVLTIHQLFSLKFQTMKDSKNYLLEISSRFTYCGPMPRRY